ncbi:unnamed protein product, partial [Polarella glacialis]
VRRVPLSEQWLLVDGVAPPWWDKFLLLSTRWMLPLILLVIVAFLTFMLGVVPAWWYQALGRDIEEMLTIDSPTVEDADAADGRMTPEDRVAAARDHDRGPPGRRYTPGPHDWMTSAQRRQHLPEEPGYIGPAVPITASMYWTTRLRKAQATYDSDASSFSSTPSTGSIVTQGVSDPAMRTRPLSSRDSDRHHDLPSLIEGLTPEEWSHLIEVRSAFSDILREDFASNGPMERRADFFRTFDASTVDDSTRDVRIRPVDDSAADPQLVAPSAADDVDMRPFLGPESGDTLMSDHPHNRQWNHQVEFDRTHYAPPADEDFESYRLVRDTDAEFYANLDVPAMVEELMDVGRGPPGQVYIPSPDDWMIPAPRRQHLPGEPSCIGPTTSTTDNIDWTTRLREAQGTRAYEASSSSTTPNTGSTVTQGVSDPATCTRPFCSLWMISRDPTLAKQIYDKNVCNLDCTGIDTPAVLPQRCVDIWLAIATAKIEPHITEAALDVCIRVIGRMNVDDRLIFASDWSETILDSVFICDDELLRRDIADKILTHALEVGGVPKGLWFQSDFDDPSMDSDRVLPQCPIEAEWGSEPPSKRSRWARSRIQKPVLTLLRRQSFVDCASPLNFLNELEGGSAPDAPTSPTDAIASADPDQSLVTGEQIAPEIIDHKTTEARWRLTNVLGFPWPIDKVCFHMATRCSISELSALTESLMSSLQLLTVEESADYDHGMALKELLSFYLVRRQRIEQTVAANSPDIVLKAGFGSWRLDMTRGSPTWTFAPASVTPSSSADHEVDINSSYETPIGGLAHLPASCNSANIAENTRSYCDLRRTRGEQKPFSDALWRVACGQFLHNDYDQEGIFMRLVDVDQKAYAFHPCLVQGQELLSDLCAPPAGIKVARPLNEGSDVENTQEQGLASLPELTSSERLKRLNASVKPSELNAAKANSISAALGFDCRGTWLRYRNDNHWNQDLRNAIGSGQLRPPGPATLLSHDEILNSTMRYITTAQQLDSSTFSNKLFEEVPCLVREVGATGPDFNQPAPVGIIHYMPNSNKGQLRLVAGAWCFLPGPLDVNANSKVWQKNIGQGWGDYAEIESITRALGDFEDRGHMNYWNCISSHQIELEILDGRRPRPITGCPLLGFYLQDKENYRWERKVSYWDLPSLLHRHGSAYTAKAPTSYEERAMINKHIGMFLAATHFLTRSPSFVMDVPGIRGHDTNHMRWRPQLDERLTVPIQSFLPEVRSYFKNSAGKWAQVDLDWRCNTTLHWIETVADEPPQNQGAPGPDVSTEVKSQKDEDVKCSCGYHPPFMMDENYHWSETEYMSKYWCEAECGLILSASSQWEMTVRSKHNKHGKKGWLCRYCNGGWDDKKTGSHFIQINDGTTFLQIILDSPDKAPWNEWAQERANCMRLEPKKPRSMVAPTLANAQESNRCRFGGAASDAIWEILYTNPDMGTIAELDLLAAMPVQVGKFAVIMAHVDSPFERAFAALPTHTFRSLLSHGYIGIQEDGELLKLMLHADKSQCLLTELVNYAVALLPDDASGLAAQEIESCLVKLGASGPGSAAVLSAVSKWRRWSPRMITDMEPVTQKELERRLRMKWVQRLVDHLAPHWEHIPNMQTVRYRPDYNPEFIHLFGAARWGSLRGHCLNLENMVKLAFGFIPWSKDKVMDLLNCSEQKNWTPSQVQRAWSTLKFLSSILGMLDPATINHLQKKKEAVCDNLVTALILPQHRADVPALDMIMMMEMGCVAPGPAADQYCMAFSRFLAGCSGLLSDAQHTQPSTMVRTSTTLEFRAWQTKTASVNQRKVAPLIAPLHSFTGVPLWETNEKFVKLFSSNNNFSNMDYLLPMVTKVRAGIIPRPMANSTGLRWIRTVLIRLWAPIAQVQKLTWPSFRVFFADWAFQAGVSRDRRRYIGRWASEATADAYTREHRSVVCQIWKEVTPRTDKLRAGHSAPEDLNQRDYQLEMKGVPDPDTPSKAPAAIKDTIDLTKGAPGLVVVDPVPATPVTTLAADLVPEQAGGPLTVICATKEIGKPSTFKIHLLKTDGGCVGCGWKPRREAYNSLNEQDFQTADRQGMNPCSQPIHLLESKKLPPPRPKGASGPDIREGDEGHLHDLRTWRRYVQPTFGITRTKCMAILAQVHPASILPPSTMTTTTSSPSAIPVAYEADVKLLHTDASRILDQYSIPYSIQATLARDGYVTIDDLSCRWDTPELARSNAEVDLGFSSTHTGWDKRASEHACMRHYQAVKKAKSIETASNDTLGASGPREGVVLQAGKRASLEEKYKKVTGTRPPLQEQGSDAFLSAQFKMCEKGEIGFFQAKQMVSAMPDPLEMAPPVKSLKPVNGFLYQDDQEERKNPYSKEQWEPVLVVFQTNLLMCVWAFPNNRLFDLEKSDLDSFYKFFLGDEIAKRSSVKERNERPHGLPKPARSADWYSDYDKAKDAKGKDKGKGKAAAAAATRDRSRTPKPGAAPAAGGKWPAEWAEFNAKGPVLQALPSSYLCRRLRQVPLTVGLSQSPKTLTPVGGIPSSMMMGIAYAIAAEQKATCVLEYSFKAPEDSSSVSNRPEVAVAHTASPSPSQGASGSDRIGMEDIIHKGLKQDPSEMKEANPPQAEDTPQEVWCRRSN